MAFSIDMDAVRDLLLEQDARRMDNQGDSSAPILGDGEVARYWGEIQPDQAHQLVAYLEDYASAKNNSKVSYVDEPIIEGEVKPGRWRQIRVFVNMEGDVARVVQVLRKGWRTTLLKNGQLDFSESRLLRTKESEGNASEVAGINNTVSDNEEKYLFVRFPNLSPSSISSIMAELRAITTVANPSIKGAAFTGTYHKLTATADIDQNDGSMNIDIILAQPQFTINSYRDWGGFWGGEITYLWNVPKEYAQQIVTDWRASGVSRGASVSFNADQGTCDIVLTKKRTDTKQITGIITSINCSATVTSDYYFDVEDPNDPAYEIGGSFYPVGTGVTYRKDVRSNNDGTYDVIISTSTVDDREYLDRVVENTKFDITSRDFQMGLSSESSLENISTHTDGEIKSRSLRYNEDCTIDATTDTQVAKTIAISGRSEQYDAAEHVSETASTNSSSEPTYPTAPSVGSIVTSSSRMNRFGRFDNSERTVTATNQTGSGGEKRFDQVATTEKNTQSVELSPANPSAGTIISYDSDPTRFGKFSTVKRTITATDQTATSTEDRADQGASTATHTSNSSTVTATHSAGVIQVAQNVPTEFGTYRTSLQTVTAKNQTSHANEDRYDQTSETEINTQAVSETIATAGAGYIQTAQNTATEFGRYRTSLQTITAIDQPTASNEDRADQSSSTDSHTHNTDEVVAEMDAIAGSIQIAQNAPTEFGTYRTVLQTITAKNQTSHATEDRYDQTSATEVNTQAGSEVTATAGAGYIQTAQNAATEFGKFRTTVQTITAINQMAENNEDRADQTSTTELNTHNTDQVVASGSQGVIQTAQNTPTEFGTFRTVLQTITANDQAGSSAEQRADQSSTTATHTHNTSTETASLVAGTIEIVQNVPTEFGTYRTSKQIVTAINQTSTSEEDRHDQFSSTVVNTQAASEATASAGTGTIQIAQNAATEFGRYRTSLQTVTANNQAATSQEARADQTSSTDTNTHNTSAVTATYSQGVIRTAQNVPTEFGTYRTALQTITAIDQSATNAEARADQASSTTTHTHNTSIVTATHTAGTIEVVQNTPTEFGTYRTSKQTITANNQTGGSTEVRGDQSSSTSIDTQSSSTSEAGGGSGTIKRVEWRPTEFGRYARTVTTITPVNQVTSSYRYTAGGTVAITRETQNDAAETGSFATGKTLSIDNAGTEFGLFNTVKSEVTATNQTGGSDEQRADQTTSTVIDTQSSTNTAAAPISGKIVSSSWQPNEFGLYQRQVTTVTPVASEYTFTYENQWHTTTVTIGKNQPIGTYQALLDTYISGESISSDCNVNAFGLEDYRIAVTENWMGELTDGNPHDVTWKSTDAKGVVWEISKKWCNSKSDAESFIGTGAASAGGGYVTGIEGVSRGRYVATKVVQFTSPSP